MINNTALSLMKNNTALNLNDPLHFKEYLRLLGYYAKLDCCIIHGISFVGKSGQLDRDYIISIDDIKNQSKIYDLIIVDHLGIDLRKAKLFVDLTNFTCFLQTEP